MTGLTDELDHLDQLDLFDDAQWSEAPQSWPATLARLFVDLGPHDAATDFVLNAPMASSPQALIYQALCELPLNEFDLQALLYPAGSHLLTTEQLQKLLARTGPASKLRVLDVGAGDGCITQNICALGCRLVASETSMGMAMRLRMGGYEVWCEDKWLQIHFLQTGSFVFPSFVFETRAAVFCYLTGTLYLVLDSTPKSVVQTFKTRGFEIGKRHERT